MRTAKTSLHIKVAAHVCLKDFKMHDDEVPVLMSRLNFCFAARNPDRPAVGCSPVYPYPATGETNLRVVVPQSQG